MRLDKRAMRHKKLKSLLRENPLLTDDDLSRMLSVSLSTVRLDRGMLGIPEVRERMRFMVENAKTRLRSMKSEDVVGELLELEPNVGAMSVLSTGNDIAFRDTNLVSDYYIYSQAASLAIATIDDDCVIIGSARLRYRQPAYVGNKILARSKVGTHKANKYVVSVHSSVDGKEIFIARFVVVAKKDIKGKAEE